MDTGIMDSGSRVLGDWIRVYEGGSHIDEGILMTAHM